MRWCSRRAQRLQHTPRGTAAWRQRHRSASDAVRDRSHHARGTASRRHLLQAVCAAVQSTGQVGDLIQSTLPAGLLTQKCFAVCCTLQAVHLVGITKTGHRDAGAMSRLLEPCGPQLMNGTTCAPLCGGQWVTMTAHQCLPLKIPGRRQSFKAVMASRYYAAWRCHDENQEQVKRGEARIAMRDHKQLTHS